MTQSFFENFLRISDQWPISLFPEAMEANLLNSVLRCGNSEEILKEIPSESIDAACCDPSFGISFNHHE
jgi:hypothetical protein